MITIIDYGIGNLRSIERAFQHVRPDVVRTDDPDLIRAADHLVLPGVGAFGACIQEVRKRELEQPILEAVARQVPFIGICVGMQMLFESSSEQGVHTGLGLLKGSIEELRPSDPTLKIPHMGWNVVSPVKHNPLLNGIPADARCYFAHSYYASDVSANNVVAVTDYGARRYRR